MHKMELHRLKLVSFPGHSPCTLVTEIDGRFLHIADELMFSPDGRPLLPTTDPNCIKRHLDSLKRLREYCSYSLLPGHGPEISGKLRIEKEIGNRIAYLSAVYNSGGRISYEEAVLDCSCDFLYKEWHDA